MRNSNQPLQITLARKTEHLTFNLYDFYFFKNSEHGTFLLRRNPRLLTLLMICPYVLLSEALFFRGQRLFIKSDEEIVGLLALREKPETLYIVSLAVKPDYRRLGVGTYTLSYAEKIAKQLEHNYWMQ